MSRPRERRPRDYDVCRGCVSGDEFEPKISNAAVRRVTVHRICFATGLCYSTTGLTSPMGHSLQGPPSGKSSHVRCGAIADQIPRRSETTLSANRRHPLDSGPLQRRPPQRHLRACEGAVHSINLRHGGLGAERRVRARTRRMLAGFAGCKYAPTEPAEMATADRQ